MREFRSSDNFSKVSPYSANLFSCFSSAVQERDGKNINSKCYAQEIFLSID